MSSLSMNDGQKSVNLPAVRNSHGFKFVNGPFLETEFGGWVNRFGGSCAESETGAQCYGGREGRYAPMLAGLVCTSGGFLNGQMPVF